MFCDEIGEVEQARPIGRFSAEQNYLKEEAAGYFCIEGSVTTFPTAFRYVQVVMSIQRLGISIIVTSLLMYIL
jgi:hypothetical protein